MPALLSLPANVRWHKCHFCGERIRSLDDGHIEFFAMGENELTYPRSYWDLTMALAHTDCGPETCYHFELRRLISDGEDWIRHLKTKVLWWCYGDQFEKDLHEAEKAARAIQEAVDRENAPRQRTILSPRLPRPPKNGDPRNISASMRAWVLERDDFTCRRCNAKSSEGAQLVVDHVVPVAKGGTADPTNLQTLCRPCNAGKTDKDPHPHDLRPR